MTQLNHAAKTIEEREGSSEEFRISVYRKRASMARLFAFTAKGTDILAFLGESAEWDRAAAELERSSRNMNLRSASTTSAAINDRSEAELLTFIESAKDADTSDDDALSSHAQQGYP